MGQGPQAGGTAYQYVRTTVLSKTTLSDSVSVNGTVKSGSSASVTAADAVKTYKVTAVNVAVGDTVRKGDIIATLDTADVEKQIANAELDSSDNRTSAEKSYTRSVEDQAADLTSAQQELAKAQQEYDTLGLNDYYSTMTTDGNTGKTNREVVTDWYTRYAEEIAGYENTLANLQIQLTQARQSGETDRAEGLQGQIEDYQNRESIAKAQCSIPELGLQGFDAVKKCYESIQNYADALQKAQESYQKSATNAARNVDDAATKLAQSQREDDKLTSLQTALEEWYPDRHDGRHDHRPERHSRRCLQRHGGHDSGCGESDRGGHDPRKLGRQAVHRHGLPHHKRCHRRCRHQRYADPHRPRGE